MFHDDLADGRYYQRLEQQYFARSLSSGSPTISAPSVGSAHSVAKRAESNNDGATATDSSTGSMSTFATSTYTDFPAEQEATGSPTVSGSGKVCTAALPAGGIIRWNDTYVIQLDQTLSFQALCANHTIFGMNGSSQGNSTVIPSQDPFYASLSPQVFALATATVISYLLVILVFITPRTFYVGGPAGSGGGGGGSAAGFLGRHGVGFPGTGGKYSGAISVGRRPLLQKIAALTVAISLTIATADTFKVAKEQYHSGYVDASTLVQNVVDSVEIRATRVVSDTFLWLAQVQTLIRLFPRHKEKVTIKWLGFALILLDTIFSILENFVTHDDTYDRAKPRDFTDAIPALSYLFEMSISLIYASCVIYYSLSKRRFAFWHSKMKNICLVALLSLAAVLIPVVFFILDVSQPNIATWGEYIRWVGAAAASVVVWEWVERIEALERDEKKNGILGREIFDGDEMLDMTPSEDMNNTQPNQYDVGGQSASREDKKGRFAVWTSVRNIPKPRVPFRKRQGRATENEKTPTFSNTASTGGAVEGQITLPQQVATPISRSDTNSAASTVYAVRYHNFVSPSPAIPEGMAVENLAPDGEGSRENSDESTLANSVSKMEDGVQPDGTSRLESGLASGRQIWHAVQNPFKRKRAEPPAEVAAQIADSNSRRSPANRPFNLKDKVSTFTSAQRSKLMGRHRSNRTPLPVTVIPAQPRHSIAQMSVSDKSDDSEAPADGAAPTGHPDDAIAEVPQEESSIPVTVIPAPVRGGRTWSPADMEEIPETSTTPSRTTSQSPSQAMRQGGGITRIATTPHGQNQSAFASRASLGLSESPVRMRDSPSTENSLLWRRKGKSRSLTMTSINDRLGSVSPGTGPRSRTADSGSTPTRNTTTGSAGSEAILEANAGVRSEAQRDVPSTTPTPPDQLDRSEGEDTAKAQDRPPDM